MTNDRKIHLKYCKSDFVILETPLEINFSDQGKRSELRYLTCISFEQGRSYMGWGVATAPQHFEIFVEILWKKNYVLVYILSPQKLFTPPHLTSPRIWRLVSIYCSHFYFLISPKVSISQHIWVVFWFTILNEINNQEL